MEAGVPLGQHADDLDQLIVALLQLGEQPDRELFDRIKAHGQAAVRPLIELAVDDRLHNAIEDSPEVWAPLHAIRLLGELRAPEAVEPLVRLCDLTDDEWLGELLPDALGGIGPPTVEPLRALLFDGERDLYARGRASTGLARIAERHPELRSEMLGILVGFLERPQSEEPDDQLLNAFVIGDLVDLRAAETAPAIRRAFDEDRVASWYIDLDFALEELGLASRPARRRPTGPPVDPRASAEPGPLLGLRSVSVGGQKSPPSEALAPQTKAEPLPISQPVARPAQPPAQVARKVGRNEPCPCGSGRKYKKCHGR